MKPAEDAPKRKRGKATVRKRTAELHEGEKRFRLMADGSPVLIWQTDGTGVVFVNKHYLKFFNESLDGVKGWGWSNFLHPADFDGYTEAYRSAFQRQEAYEFQCRFRRHDGEWRWLHNAGTPHLAEDGSFLGFFGSSFDVTESKQVEEALRRSEERYRSLLNSIDEGFCVIEMLFDNAQKAVDYRFIEINPAFEKQAGMQGATGKRMLEFVSHIEPHWLENYGRVALTGEPIRFADEYKSLGSWFDVYAFRVGDPESRRVAVLFNNITQRRQSENALRESEERFRMLAENITQLAWVADPGGSLVWYSKRWYDYTGTTAAEMQGWGWQKVHHPDHLERVTERWKEHLLEGKAWEDTFPLRGADGQYRWFLSSARPIRDGDENIVRWFGTNTDITALREAETAARAASIAKDNFLAQLSHELRTPLTPVLMTANALCDDEKLPAYAREQLRMIERNVALEARLIDDLLDLTRITRGKLALREEPCNLHSLVRLAVEIVMDEACEKQVDITVNLTAERSQLDGDPTRLQQVFWNLLRNAVKFTPSGGHVRVRSYDATRGTAADGIHRVCVEVSDNGIGFEPGDAERLFLPFEQGTIANNQRSPGLGLGLAIARAIVDLHGGRIRAESAGPGRGAKFTVEMTGAERPAVEHPNREVSDAAPAVEPQLRLLLIEDHDPTLQVLARLLRRSGHQLTTATSVAGALAAAETGTFDGVMSDLGLPDGTGFELMEKLRSRYGLRGIALSGYGMDEDLRRSRDAGFIAHLIKPVNINEVRHALRKLASNVGKQA